MPVEDHATVCPPARPPPLSSLHWACSRHSSPFSARPGTSTPTHAVRRFFAGYPGLVGSAPPAISALTALTFLCVPFARPGSPPTRRMRRFASAWAVHLRRNRMPLCARSGIWTRTASLARSSRASRRSPGWPTCTPRRRPCVSQPTRPCERAHCGAGTCARTASPAACRRRSPR
jgi:hypothetical protein